jgi:hypothetical protein
MAVKKVAVAAEQLMPEPMPEARGDPDPELIYDELLSHVAECGTCWPWRNQLWAVKRLCPIGAGLADRYAVAEAARRGRGR